MNITKHIIIIATLFTAVSLSLHANTTHNDELLARVKPALLAADVDPVIMATVESELQRAWQEPNSLTGRALRLLGERSLDLSTGSANYGLMDFVKEKLLPGGKALFDKAKTLFPEIADKVTGAISKLASVLTPERVAKVMAIVSEITGNPELKESAINLAKTLETINEAAQKIDKTRKERGDLDAAGEIVKMLIAGKIAEMHGGDMSDIQQVSDKIAEGEAK